MMKINWKVRARNPQFWLQVALAVAVPIGAYFGITGADITSWLGLWEIVMSAVANPYVLFMVVASLYGSILDPTTKGVSDSERALKYDVPNEEVDR